MEELQEMLLLDPSLLSNSHSMGLTEGIELIVRFLFNCLITLTIIRLFYYPKSRRRDYFFTFTLISISVFFLIFLLGSVKLKIGFALGLFAIFGIIRYRTESVPIREMTYLFVIIAISVINALGVEVGTPELLLTNIIFILCIWISESNRWLRHISCKHILYDRIDLITPDKEDLLMEDLRKRTGLNIEKVEIGHIDFLRDATMIKVYYEPRSNEINTIDNVTRLPRENEQ